MFCFFRVYTKKLLRSKIEAIRVAGYPVTMEGLEQRYSMLNGVENAADLIIEGMYDYYNEPNNEDVNKILTDSNNDISVFMENYSKEIVTLIGEFLEENKKVLEMLHKASSMQFSRYSWELNDPNRPGKGILLLVLDGIKLLNLETIYFSKSSDSESAKRSIITSFNIADSLAKEPMLIFHVIRMVCYSRNISILQHIINHVDFTDEQLIKLNQSVTDALDFSGFSNVFAGEMCRTFNALNNDDNITEDIIPDKVALPIAQFYMFFYKHLGIVDIDRSIYLDYMNQYIEAAKLPLQERYNTFPKIDEQIRNLSGIHLLKTEFPNFYKSIDRDKKIITRIQITQAAIAVKRYYLAKGTLPDNIEDLIPAYLDKIPVTPDGKELKYKRIEEGCIIYSEGNGKININKTPPQSDFINHEIQNMDIWFIIENN